MLHGHPPLTNRIIKSRSKPIVETTSHGFRGSYRAWDEVSMENAVKEVEMGESIRRAAEMYGIPRSTLHNRVTGKTGFDAKPGPDPYLNLEEEKELASFLIQSAKIGYPHTKNQVLAMVQRIFVSKGKDDLTVTNGWWERFCQRHPNISLRTAAPLSFSRAKATDPVVLNHYFDILESCLNDNKIMDCPSRIYNCDETGLPLNPKCLKIVDEKGAKNPSYVTGESKTQITVLACTSAAGYAIPPFVIFPRKSLNPALTKGEVPGTLYGLTGNGWMNRELFYHWLTHHFLLYAPATRPVLLLLDGHSSHYCPEAVRIAAENKVIIFALPPNTTHISQPLDRSCFAPLKMAWRNACHEFYVNNPGRAITQYDFSEIFAKSWYKAFSMNNIIAGFRVTGVCPFNRSVIKQHSTDLEDESSITSFRRDTLAQRTGLAYIPLYSTPTRNCSNVVSTDQSAKKAINYSTPCQSFLSSPRYSVLHNDSSYEPERSLFHCRDFRAASVPVPTTTALGKFLPLPVPPNKMPTKCGKSSGKVLTSKENLLMIQEREQKKLEEARLKAERKRLREEKAQLKKLETERKKAVKMQARSTKQIGEDFYSPVGQAKSTCWVF